MIRKGLPYLLLVALLLPQVSCKHFMRKAEPERVYTEGPDTPPEGVVTSGVAVTLRDQKLTLFQNGQAVKKYPISSSKFGIGNKLGSWKTPTGVHVVHSKFGANQPKGMVFKGCRPTGEIVEPDAKGRDTIVSRVIPLTGMEKDNRLSYRRHIYLHGTAAEKLIGRPSSYGCIRMRSDDIIELYSYIQRGTPVVIETCSQKVYEDAVTRACAPTEGDSSHGAARTGPSIQRSDKEGVAGIDADKAAPI